MTVERSETSRESSNLSWGFWKVSKFRLVELRSYVFPSYVFLGVNDME